MPSKKPLPLTPGAIVTAGYFLNLSPPRVNWEASARCRTISDHTELPQECGSGQQREIVAREFVPKYCGNCAVRTECVQAMLGAPAEPLNTVHGGYLPSAARQMWRAAKEVVADGGVENAAKAHGLHTEGVGPKLPYPGDLQVVTPQAT